MGAEPRIAALSDVPADSTLVFRVQDADGTDDEAILTRAVGTDDGAAVACWLNRCQHFRHVRLDGGDGAPVRGGEIVCANHGAIFTAGSGRCTHGPCEGAVLDRIGVAVRDGDVVLDDDRYALVGHGPLPDDGDLTSTSNVEF
jgi:nitrite reductase/ring-hydroxylating ferredoxin subunit